MTAIEFYERTGVEVSAQEYREIGHYYMHFNGNKDAFCALWVAMHKDRVEAARERERAAKLEGEKLDRFFEAVFYLVSPKRGKLAWDPNYRYDRNFRELYKAMLAQKAKISLQDVERIARRFVNSKCFGSIEKNLVYALTL